MNEAVVEIKEVNKGLFMERAASLVNMLDARSKDIIKRRYGLETGRSETLDSIGREYGITRERVRQIEAQAKKLLAQRRDLLDKPAETLNEVFAKHGGVMTEAHLNEVIKASTTGEPKSALIYFYLDILPEYTRVIKSEEFLPHWALTEVRNEMIEVAAREAASYMEEVQESLVEEMLWPKVRERVEADYDTLPDPHLVAAMEASKKMKRTVYGEWGLVSWVETSPRGVGDKAFIVLKRYGKPAHFRDITKMINEVSFDHKRAHEQTVHNELIKDERFVLVGRGLYGLTDWGFIPGTVADVLEAILVKAERPMTREELLEKVLEQRLVKKTTVLLGLQNNERFLRVEDDKYGLRG